MADVGQRVGLLWRGTPSERATATFAGGRFEACAAALRATGLVPEPCIYAEEVEGEVEAQLDGIDAILVWVNPTDEGRDRRHLDAMLLRAAARGVLVSAHPDAILAIGTKEVLHRTRGMPWGSDVQLYTTLDELRRRLPGRLASGGSRVLKPNRGQSGQGIWLIERAGPDQPANPDMPVRVREAPRGSPVEVLPLRIFVDRCAGYFADGGLMIEQPYVARLPEGMTRCYLVGPRIEGFGHQAINALHPPPPGAPPEAAPQAGPRLYSGQDDQRFQRLRRLMEDAWIPELLKIVGTDVAELPVLWDADFLLGPKTATGDDSYVLCEINVSSVSPFPESALAPIAAEITRRLRLHAKPPRR
jgi:hypothetical protein